MVELGVLVLYHTIPGNEVLFVRGQEGLAHAGVSALPANVKIFNGRHRGEKEERIF